MKVEKRRNSDERIILTALVTDRTVLATIASRWEPKLFASPWASLVGGWCVDYFRQYEDAPGRSIEGLYETWAGKKHDPETVKLVEKFLGRLSEEYERADRHGSSYVLDLAATHFNRVRAARIAEHTQAFLDQGNVAEAQRVLEEYHRLEIGLGAGVDVLQDAEAVRRAFASAGEDLIEYPGALGQFFHRTMCRGKFLAFMGPEKRGKTWLLMDVAWRAMLDRRRVAFFSVGDMTEAECLERLAVRAARLPLEPCTVQWPTAIAREEDEPLAVVTHEERKFREVLSPAKATAALERVRRSRIKSHRTYFKLAAYPNDTINVAGLRAVLDRWEIDGWVPDVVVIDYADILAPPAGAADTRDQINATWKQLRALSQTQHCLVVTATQSDAASYSAALLGKWNFSEDKRKHSHVTGMVGINATVEEEGLGLYRLNWLHCRDKRTRSTRCVHVAACLDLGCPTVRSTW